MFVDVTLDFLVINATKQDAQMEIGELTVQDHVLVKMEDVVNLIPDNVYVLQDGGEFIVKILVIWINMV
jgi:hypothetical protein